MSKITINAVPNSSGKNRIYGTIGEVSRIWVGEIVDGSKMLHADTVLSITNSSKFGIAGTPSLPIEVFAGDVMFDNIYKR